VNLVLGEVAAVASALCFSITSIFFTSAGRSVGAALPMRLALPLAWLMLALVHWLRLGQPLPLDAGQQAWIYLGLSGVFGFWLGMVVVLQALVLIGPRLSSLVIAFAPVLTTIFAWIIFDEALDGLTVFGIVLTIGGIIVVVADKSALKAAESKQALRLGVIMALLGALGQAVSVLLARQGLATGIDPLSGNMVRISTGMLALWIWTILHGQAGATLRAFSTHPAAFRMVALASLFGPFTGALLVLVALQNAPVGIATTLSNLTPVFLIPISYIVFREAVTLRAVVGTVVALTGTALLFL